MDSSWEKVDSKIDDSVAGFAFNAFKLIGGDKDTIFHRLINLPNRTNFPLIVVASNQETSLSLQQNSRNFAEQFGEYMTFMESDGQGNIKMKMR
jgi:hypothetical protein